MFVGPSKQNWTASDTRGTALRPARHGHLVARESWKIQIFIICNTAATDANLPPEYRGVVGRVMKRWALLAAMVAALSLQACAPGIDSQQARATKDLDDRFLPYSEIAGAEMRHSFGLLSGAWQSVQLLARRDRKTAVLTTHARVRIGYVTRGRIRFESARAPTTDLLPLKQLAHDGAHCQRTEGCPHLEDVLVDLPEPALRAAQKTGYSFRLYTRDGVHATFPIPPQLIETLFKAADAHNATVAANTRR